MEKVDNIQEHMGWKEKDENSKNLKEIVEKKVSETKERLWWAHQFTRN